MRNKSFFLAFAFTFAIGFQAMGDEGMWVYNNLPKKLLKDTHGFEVTDAWSEHVMKSAVRFNSGGSGSFVSANGLVITNHHVAGDTLQKLSTAGSDLYKKGFLAKTQGEEVQAPDLELNQLVSIEDVTDRVNAAVKPGMADKDAAAARRAAMAAIEKESLAQTGLRSDVITLYQGGQYHLYRYKKYTDVRLVFAPEFDIAFFGGDADNFEYPRYDLDIAFFRVYENGAPAKIDHYLKWSTEGAKDGDLIFVSGNPGTTRRMYTTASLKYLRDVSVPFTIQLLNRREILYQQYAQLGDTQAFQSKKDLFYVQNSRKVYLGRLAGLQSQSFLAAKQQAEYKLRAAAQSNPELKQFSGAWDRIAKTLYIAKTVLERYSLLESGSGFNSQLFTLARTLVRMAAEDQKPDAERLPEYRASARASLEQQLYSPAPIFAEFEKFRLADGLSFLVQRLGHDHKLVKRILAGRDPKTRASEIVDGTSLSDVNVRKLLASGGQAAISESYDTMIELAKLVDSAARKIRKQYEDEVDEPQKQAYSQISKVLFATLGTNTYPDATFTLRLAFGLVKGYQDNGKTIPPLTTIGGAFDHEAIHGGKEPYLLPKSWHDHKAELNLSTPYNFVSTADIIGGNSGSPVISRAGEFVGIIFDGNIHSLVADYAYTEEKSRAVSVHSAAILETLKKVYAAPTLASELSK